MPFRNVLHATWLAGTSARGPLRSRGLLVYGARYLVSESAAAVVRSRSIAGPGMTTGKRGIMDDTTTRKVEVGGEADGSRREDTADEQKDATAQSRHNADLSMQSPTQLIARITELEARLKETTARLSALTTQYPPSTPPPPKKPRKTFDFSRYGTRHIAIKFAYLGHRYNGFEHTNGMRAAVRPTVEEALWKGLRKARLIPVGVPEGCDGSFDVVFDEAERKRVYWEEGVRLEVDWKGLAYSKCGRTDKGVSGFGQVVGVTVRSNRPKRAEKEVDEDGSGNEVDADEALDEPDFDDVRDEIPYISVLNSVLPSDIKVLAWCPDPGESFDARFSCRERRYKYFFTNPAFCPTPGDPGLKHATGQDAPVREGWLDIEAMRTAAKKLEGLHDFRNFCKIDPSKQMSGCERRITFTDVEEWTNGVGLSVFGTDSRLNKGGVGQSFTNGLVASVIEKAGAMPASSGPKVYSFSIHGTAFLWHQVRCMVAVLFLVGQGLEKPEVVDELLDIAVNPARPLYEMASDAPLVLWDCIFPGDEPGDVGGIKWIYAGDEASISAAVKKVEGQHDGKFGVGGLVTDLWQQWREAKMKETLTAGLLGLALSHGDSTSLQRSGFRTAADAHSRSQRVFDGGDAGRTIGSYTTVMKKPRSETLEALNAKYLNGKQARRDLKKA